MRRLRRIRQLICYFGLSWLIYRVIYAVQMRSGWTRWRNPVYQWANRLLASWLLPGIPSEPAAYRAWRAAHQGKFFFDTVVAGGGSQQAVDQADRLLAGNWTFFSKTVYALGFPPDWHLNPLTGTRGDAARHWSQINEFSSGDVKFVWETSRFSAAFLLVRAYAFSHDERYSKAFWMLVEDWAQHNPPQLGANWLSGQELAFRVMAWCFGLYGFSASPHTTPERVALLSVLITAHAEHIERNIAYARSQKNNHGLSEGVGLWTVGLLFPEFKGAAAWREHGQRVICEELLRQIYDDGAYVQHSTNYQRLMLHDCLWAARLGELNGAPLPDPVLSRIEKSADFLYQLIDPQSGNVPNYGANDGALILPLNDCDYADFRPVLQGLYYLRHQQRLFPPGLWDEDMRWLWGEDSLEASRAEIPLHNLSAESGGYYTVRSPSSWLMTRCARYRDRPGHADQLHVDLWWHSLNIACDAGTYLYNAVLLWDNRLASTDVHNTVSVDGRDQMERAGRFLWLEWAQGRVLRRSASRQLEYWEGGHNGYQRIGVLHRRGILKVNDDVWLILDHLRGEALHEYRLNWLLADYPYMMESQVVRLQTPQGAYTVQVGSDVPAEVSLIRAQESGTRGWLSRYYGDKTPALSYQLSAKAQHALFWTLFSPAACTVALDEQRLSVTGQNWRVDVATGEFACRLSGEIEDQLP